MWRKVKNVVNVGIIVTVVMVLSILLNGCSVGFAVGADADVYWPKMKTKDGGSFGDPEASRQQATRHTTNVSRNNLPMVGE